ncbi:PLP-dependent aminotransferase family protein [Bradyrhizobium sp. BRP22]|uniref:MocR-like pyridoxine biosynthesis transcription factor PdxR n=1 Tax=Bradyrhizobium sp. BRP22 TaxID=2793821 RepID=UPI001CD554E0
MLITLDRNGAESLQEQIYQRIREQIVAGTLRAGASVPSSRLLAAQLKVSRNSVIFGYERLINEGYLVAKPMVGTFVADVLPDRTVSTDKTGDTVTEAFDARTAPVFTGRPHAILNNSNIPIDFWTQRTDPRAFPLKTWRRLIMQSLAAAGYNLTEYGDPCGLMPLRIEIAEHVGTTRGFRVRPEQVVIVAGAQLALNLVLRLLASPDDEIAVENPCNQGAAYLFESYRMRLLPIAVDRAGIDAQKVVQTNAKLAYLTPSHQFPTGATLSLERRRAIARWAQQSGAHLIEDDYDSEFRYDGAPLPAMKALAPDHVIYLGTFSKSLGAGLRTGFAIFPEHLVDAAATAKALLDNGQVWLEQAALARFMQGGGFVRHLRRCQQHYYARRNALIARMRERFGDADLMGTEAGTHVAWRLPASLAPAHNIKAIARTRNIGVYTVQSGGGHEYDGDHFETNWLLLGYASLTEDQIRAGIDRLAEVLAVNDMLQPGARSFRTLLAPI